ncbi:Hsp70 family protein [Roseibium album]|uniref:Heat shock protein 70 n=1 Tax=Roseibium album TaxID=311410 RepID=A0A0M6ZL10_9HYPH|nr:Hsp70 family protein [Roseibium album]CTQ62184.1 Heat shock protein 70 [Roseibium album]CTQ78651.1 Heat shock protein 70 [Roseibium album]CTQ79949.1 Heat shock protein 70 [Roseibium album]
MTETIGLDFGTSNTVAVAARQSATQPVHFQDRQETFTSLPTVLSFLDRGAARALHPEVGPWAIRQFLESFGDVRFIQSLKTFAASRLFKGTGVYGVRFEFEDLMATFLRCAFERAGTRFDPAGTRLVVGRPVEFAGHNPDETLAMERYRRAFRKVGFEDILFVMEPVGAAFSYAQSLERDTTILVADLGGGTTDYSIMRFETAAGHLKATPLGRGGIGIAGDTFDYRIIDNVVLPKLGKGSAYQSMGKVLEIPPNLFSNFARWHMLSIFKTSDDFKEMKKLLRWCLEADKIELFIELVDEDQGYPLYKSVSETKARLSSDDEAEFSFAPLGADFRAMVSRQEFEGWIAADLAKMDKALDATLAKAGLSENDIDRVFMTGGTSFVPAVRHQFANRFGTEKISGGNELTSVANGLALIGAREDAGDWAVAA